MGITGRIGSWAQARAGQPSAAPALLTALGGLATHAGQQILARQHEEVTAHRDELAAELGQMRDELGRYRERYGPLEQARPAENSSSAGADG